MNVENDLLMDLRAFDRGAGVTRESNPRGVLYVEPNAAARKTAQQGLDARRAAVPSKKGGLDTRQAGEQGIGSGVARARDIVQGKRVDAFQVKAFFDRHRGNYEKAMDRGLAPEESKAIQAWLLWGGEPMRRIVEKAVEEWQTEN